MLLSQNKKRLITEYSQGRIFPINDIDRGRKAKILSSQFQQIVFIRVPLSCRSKQEMRRHYVRVVPRPPPDAPLTANVHICSSWSYNTVQDNDDADFNVFATLFLSNSCIKYTEAAI